MNNHSFPPGSLAAAYFRDSGGDTQELSVPQQESAFRAWCAQNGLIPGAIFKDVARPGSSVIGRAGFHDMIHHFRSGQAQEAGLVIWSYSRFAREFDDSQFYRADLRRRGFIFFSLNDAIPEGSIGRLFEAVIDWKNENFLEDLSRDTRRGLHDLVQTHGAIPGTPPRGFKREKIVIGKRRSGQDRIAHRWAPNPDELPRVRQAFAMRADGYSLAEIHAVTHLYGSINSYKTFYTNKLYIGILEFGDLVIKDYCVPIIDRPTWEAVQLVIDAFARHKNLSGQDGNPQHPRRHKSSYLLSGLVYCARCSSPLFGAPSKQHYKPDGTRNADYERYACARAYRRRDCNQGQFPKKILEDAVLSTLENYILLPDVLAEMQSREKEDRENLLSKLEEKRTEYKNILRGIRRRIANLTEAIAESGHTRALLEKLSGLEAEETALRSQMAEIERQANAPALDLGSSSQIDQTLQSLHAILDSGEHQAIQEMLRGFIARITVDRDENKIIGSITYYLPTIDNPGPSLPYETVSIPLTSLGAPLHRHSFTVSFTATMRRYNKKALLTGCFLLLI
jgi:DNA invertase Pin-like site-specific DNA recombinase